MERNQFIHSKDSPFKIFIPRHSSAHHFKKPKRNFKSPSIPFYQSSKFQKPNNHNPRPRKPYWPKTYTRKYISPYTSQPMTSPPPPPNLINPSDSKKFLEIMKNVQPGINTFVQGEVEKIIKAARWEGLVSHLGKYFHVHLMGEFYCNMKIIKGLGGELHFTTSVKKKTIMIDHKTINKALYLPARFTEFPCIDFYSNYMFNKAEFPLMLGVFTNSDIPLGLCNTNCGIHYKHFTPVFQNLALILRANIMPKPNQSKYFDFYDLKMLFLLCTNKIDFSISYVILLNMVNAYFIDYMPYGLLLSSIFDIFHISVDENFATLADSFLSHEHIRTQVSLVFCEPQIFTPTVIPPIIREEDVYLSKFESVKMMFDEQKCEMARLQTENNEIKGRLYYIEGLACAISQNSLGPIGPREVEIIISFQVQMVNDTSPLDFESVGIEIGAQGIETLPEIDDEFGFVAVVPNGAG